MQELKNVSQNHNKEETLLYRSQTSISFTMKQLQLGTHLESVETAPRKPQIIPKLTELQCSPASIPVTLTTPVGTRQMRKSPYSKHYSISDVQMPGSDLRVPRQRRSPDSNLYEIKEPFPRSSEKIRTPLDAMKAAWPYQPRMRKRQMFSQPPSFKPSAKTTKTKLNPMLKKPTIKHVLPKSQSPQKAMLRATTPNNRDISFALHNSFSELKKSVT